MKQGRYRITFRPDPLGLFEVDKYRYSVTEAGDLECGRAPITEGVSPQDLIYERAVEHIKESIKRNEILATFCLSISEMPTSVLMN